MVKHFLWGYFKYWLMPVSIFAGCAGWNAHTFYDYLRAAGTLVPDFVGHGFLSSIFGWPPAMVAYLFIPKSLVYPVFGVAAIAGEVGIFVVIWLFCSFISPPKFLLAGDN